MPEVFNNAPMGNDLMKSEFARRPSTRGAWWKTILVLICLPASVWGGTFGKQVILGAHAADLALDESRGVLYVASFTGNRVDVMSLADSSVQTSLNVASQPSSLALSPDNRFLVVAHYGNFTSPSTARNALTVIDLTTNSRQTFALADPPLGVAFGIDGLALVVTTHEFLSFDPLLGTNQVVDTIAGVTAKTLPQPPANFPTQIVAASVASSANGRRVFGLTDTLLFTYDVLAKRVFVVTYTSEPTMGPRAVSASRDGSYWLGGWGMFDDRGLLAQFPDP